MPSGPLSFTCLKIVNLIRHGLGATPSAELDLWDVLNIAGRALFTEHAWSWRHSGPITIAAVAGNGFIELPEDFGELVECQALTTSGPIELTTTAEIARLTARGLSSPLYAVAFDAWSSDLPPKPRALVWPTPATAGLPTLAISYYRRWRETSEQDGNKPPNVPAEWHMALLLRARAEAKLLQNDEAASAEFSRYAEELNRLKLVDGAKQVNYGQLRGGAGRFRGQDEEPAGPNWGLQFP